MTWNNTVNSEKEFSGYLELSHQILIIKAATTSRSRLDELWAFLDYKLFVSDYIELKLLKKGITSLSKKKKIKANIQAYINQAKNFYNVARSSDFKSAPLPYYYAFMNLAKVKVLLDNPNCVDKKFVHGIKRWKDQGLLIERSCVVGKSSANIISVFGELYKAHYNEEIHGKAISFKYLMGYMTDIGDEVSKVLSYPDNKKVHPVKYFEFIDNVAKKSWPVLSTPMSFRPQNYPSTYKKFTSQFDRFDPSPTTVQSVFNISRYQANLARFSQSKNEFNLGPNDTIPLTDSQALINFCFGKNQQQATYSDTESFSIVDPLRKNWAKPFNEMFAIYMMMYYLSEIVRYRPEEMENSYASINEGWMIKGFVEATPYTCLVQLIAEITGEVYIITERT